MLLKWYINISQELISWVKFYVPSRKIHLPSLKARCRLSISLSFCATILYRFETSSSFMRHIPQSFCSMRRKLKESEVSEPGVEGRIFRRIGWAENTFVRRNTERSQLTPSLQRRVRMLGNLKIFSTLLMNFWTLVILKRSMIGVAACQVTRRVMVILRTNNVMILP